MKNSYWLVFLFFELISCSTQKLNKGSYSGYTADSLQNPRATKSAKNYSQVIGWKDGEMPVAPKGFSVNKFADVLHHPSWI